MMLKSQALLQGHEIESGSVVEVFLQQAGVMYFCPLMCPDQKKTAQLLSVIPGSNLQRATGTREFRRWVQGEKKEKTFDVTRPGRDGVL